MSTLPPPVRRAHRLVATGAPATRQIFAWGFLVQALSSATNFGLTLGVGRLLGPAELGVVVIGFAAYQLLLGLQRAIVTQPIIAYGAPLDHGERRRLAGSGLTLVGASGIVATVVAVAIGLVAGRTYGRGFVLFAPWVGAALLQEYWRTILFQEDRGAAAAFSELVRLGMTLLGGAMALVWRHDYVVVGMWGLGSGAALAIALVRYPGRPAGLRTAVATWRRHAWGLGRWLGGREIVWQLLTYATILTLTFIVGTTGVGGFRAASALFSPFSLLAAALVLPALPALSRAAAQTHDQAVALTLRITAVAVSIGMLYVVLMSVTGAWLLVHLFGHSFAPFSGLVWPLAASQALGAAGIGFTLLLSAEARGRASFIAGVALAVAVFALTTTFALWAGVTGAAWGNAIGMGVGSGAAIALALRPPSVDRATSPNADTFAT